MDAANQRAFRRWGLEIQTNRRCSRNARLSGVSNFRRKDFPEDEKRPLGMIAAPHRRFGKRCFNQDDAANYPRREPGGARPACKSQALASGAKNKAETLSSPASGAGGHSTFATNAGGPCRRLTQAECLSPPACRTARLLVEDSSISVRIACRSSVAEITGNSRTSTQPSASKHCSALTLRNARAPAHWRHSQ
jgi:hypothetical protein